MELCATIKMLYSPCLPSHIVLLVEVFQEICNLPHLHIFGIVNEGTAIDGIVCGRRQRWVKETLCQVVRPGWKV
jgi:hypothetical protein